ncbi:MAG: hypothetical protein H6Q65_1216 [Firmicutes bacterium]|nr:hypothetical protein [Bacillota bacterium]
MRKPWFCQECRVVMKYDEKYDFHKCPECGFEAWPPDKVQPVDEITSLMKDKAKAHKPREVPPAGEAMLGGGGSKNSVKKPKSKKLSLHQLNLKLHNEV